MRISALFCLVASIASAQQFASVSGIVTDSAGAVIPSISVARQCADRQEIFQRDVFVRPAIYTFGTLGPDRGDRAKRVHRHISILKDFSFHKRHTLQFRAEMLNFVNHPNFALPDNPTATHRSAGYAPEDHLR